MLFDDYDDLNEQDGGKLFMIPEKIESKFLAAKEEGTQMSHIFKIQMTVYIR